MAIAMRARTAFASRWPRGRQLVRARTHFSMPATTPPARGAQLSALLRALSPATELPLRVATYTYAEPARRALRVVISAEAGNGADGVGAWLGFVLVDAAGIIAATATVESRSGQYAFSCVVPEGRYTLRAAAIDAMGLQGSVERVFAARLAGTTELRFGDLMLAPVPASPSAPLSPIVDRAIGDALVAYLEFQATDADSIGSRARGHRARSFGTTIVHRHCGGLDPHRRLGRGQDDDSDRRTSAGRVPRPRGNRRRRRAGRRHFTTVHDRRLVDRPRARPRVVKKDGSVPAGGSGAASTY